jgi:hypothetical protein
MYACEIDAQFATIMPRRPENHVHVEMVRSCKMNVEQQRKPIHVKIQHHNDSKIKCVCELTRSCKMDVVQQRKPIRAKIQHHGESQIRFVLN